MYVSLFYSPARLLDLDLLRKDNEQLTGRDLLRKYLPEKIVADFYIVCNGHKVDDHSILENGKNYHVIPRLVGGKGGFGSMLRAIGAQIEKTTSREACRDLSGRRMRDINNEKKLKEWLAKEADREKEREERRAEKRSRELNRRHKFEDKVYHQQKEKVAGDLEEALQKGLKKTHTKDETNGPGPAKKAKMLNKEWMGMDLDSDDLDSGSDMEACPEICEDLASASCSSQSDTAGTSSSSQLNKDKDKDHDSSGQSTSSTDNLPSTSKSSDEKSLLSLLPAPVNTAASQSEQTGEESTSKPSSDDIQNDDVGKEPEVDPATPVDLDLFTSSDALAGLGLERLKVALMTRGLKCGGTLAERAGRLFSVKGLKEEEIDPALRAKGKGKKSR